MRLLTCLELDRYTKSDLWDLYRQALFALAELPPDSLGYANARLNLRRICSVLARRAFMPRP